MKLRHKKTGETIDSKDLLTDEVIKDLFSKDFKYFDSKLNNIQRMWEDYEETQQNEYWYINQFGNVVQVTYTRENIYDKSRKSFGNYFETKKEAERAVEKLKAWKLLKDECDIKFDGIIRDNEARLKAVKLVYDRHQVTLERMRECVDALHLLFGDEDEIYNIKAE